MRPPPRGRRPPNVAPPLEEVKAPNGPVVNPPDAGDEVLPILEAIVGVVDNSRRQKERKRRGNWGAYYWESSRAWREYVNKKKKNKKKYHKIPKVEGGQYWENAEEW